MVSQWNETNLALWWVASGHIPSVSEGKERLYTINKSGPTLEAFNFRNRFTSSGERIL